MKAKIRKDLLDEKVSVPVGDIFYGDASYLPAKWAGETFQVYLNNKWLNAESIDWEFKTK
ncbi:MAG: hypothetical protein ACK5DE_14025 [Bacteroidota bacterium]|jgi:hypothetical protein